MKDKNHNHLYRCKKAFDKIKHTFMMKTLHECCIKGMYLNIIKANYDKPIAIFTLNSERLNAFPLRLGLRQGYPLSPLLISHLPFAQWTLPVCGENVDRGLKQFQAHNNKRR